MNLSAYDNFVNTQLTFVKRLSCLTPLFGARLLGSCSIGTFLSITGGTPGEMRPTPRIGRK